MNNAVRKTIYAAVWGNRSYYWHWAHLAKVLLSYHVLAFFTSENRSGHIDNDLCGDWLHARLFHFSTGNSSRAKNNSRIKVPQRNHQQ